MTPKVLRQLRRTALSLSFAIKHKHPRAKRQRLEIQLQTLLTEALAGTKFNHLAGNIFEKYVLDDGEFLYSDFDRDLRAWDLRGSPPHRLTGKILEDDLGL
jgi:hypothetical protein